MDSPLRGKTAPLLSALSRFSVCGPENGQSPFSVLLRRKILPRELCEAKFSPPICSTSERMSNTDVPLRTEECLCRAQPLPLQRGFKRGLPLSLEVSGPSGPDCVFGDFLHTRKSPRCGARSSTIYLQKVRRRGAGLLMPAPAKALFRRICERRPGTTHQKRKDLKL